VVVCLENGGPEGEIGRVCNMFGQRPTEELLAKSTYAHDVSLIVPRALAVR
jgi:hypothetical protein